MNAWRCLVVGAVLLGIGAVLSLISALQHDDVWAWVTVGSATVCLASLAVLLSVFRRRSKRPV